MAKNIHNLAFQLVLRQKSILGRMSARFYGRWTHRNPAKILLPFESNSKVNLKKEKIIDLDPGILHKNQANQSNTIDGNGEKNETTNQSVSTLSPEKSKELKDKKEQRLKKRNFFLSQKKVFDENGEIMYEKLKESDGRISSMLVKLKSKKERSRSGNTLVEGWRLIVDGLEAKCILKYVIFSRVEEMNKLRPFLPKTGVEFYKIPYKEMELWSDLETSPGIFGVFETPTTENIKRLSKPLPLHFICDNIRVPGNLGAILRAAVGVGCEKVLLSKGCVDVWDPKVIRSGAGAHFRLPIHNSIEWTEMHNFLEKDTSVFIADSNANVPLEEEPNEHSNNEFECQIPILPYYGVEFSTLRHITIILGGETEGISEDSYALAASRNGVRLNIPLQRGVDSLNTGMATAIIAFEIRKQLIQAWTKIKLGRQIGQAT